MTKIILHFEGFVIFISAIIAYGVAGYSWWLFVVLLLAPDISMLGYLKNAKVGAYVYNIFHTYVIAFLILGLGYVIDSESVIAIGVIWIAHIGMDRLFGFGLKYTDSFQSTHLGTLKKG
ncbi:MAG TPA: DUF4260 domain-containing protein [Virgibacillus sp.]|nr:DUF4260 domain-containing protein [Virgibacillus sp.]